MLSIFTYGKICRRIHADTFAQEEAAEAARIHVAHRQSDSEPGVDVSTCQSDGEQVSMSFGRQPGEDDATARARFRADTFAQEEATRRQIRPQRFVQEEEAGAVSTCQSDGEQVSFSCESEDAAAEDARIHAAHLARAEAARARHNHAARLARASTASYAPRHY